MDSNLKGNYSIKKVRIVGLLLAFFVAFFITSIVNTDNASAAEYITVMNITGLRTPNVGSKASDASYFLHTDSNKYTATYMTWLDENNAPMVSKFENGKLYSAYVYVKANDGYILYPNSYTLINGVLAKPTVILNDYEIIYSVGPFIADSNKHRIDLITTDGGTILLDKYTAAPGELVTVYITPNKNRKIDYISGFTDKNYGMVNVVGQGNQRAFIMPAENVTMLGNFVKSSRSTSPNSIIVNATHGPNGSISPVGDSEVTKGGSITYYITPDDGYGIAEVFIDGVNIGRLTSYTFANVSEDHEIKATYYKK